MSFDQKLSNFYVSEFHKYSIDSKQSSSFNSRIRSKSIVLALSSKCDREGHTGASEEVYQLLMAN